MRRAVLALAVGVGLSLWPAPPVQAQEDDVDAACAAQSAGARAECRLAASTARLIQSRLGVGLWGGSPVPGSASTLGMRLGSLPRVTTSGRIVALPMELPPLLDRTRSASETAIVAGLSGQGAVGILPGLSPLPTVGGFLSMDAIARVSVLALPGTGFQDQLLWGGLVGLRLGLLRESFTLPGISVTGSYGLSTRFNYGASDGTHDGFVSGGISTFGATASATKRLGAIGLTLGAALDRYGGEIDFSFPGAPPGTQTADAETLRWSAFGNLSWTLLIFHASIEAGWQDPAVADGLPTSITLDPTGWWGAAAFRISI